MKRYLYLVPSLLLLSACGEGAVSRKTETVDGNMLQITSGTMHTGRYVAVENVDRRWEGGLKGGRGKWLARKNLLKARTEEEMERICDNWPYVLDRGPHYNMMDKDETMGGMAPVLGMTVAVAAYAVASASTDDANIPVSAYTDFHCRNDEFTR